MAASSNEIYGKILEISNKYLSGQPPIHISSIAEELGVAKNVVAEHISALKTLNLIESMGSESEIIVLSDAKRIVLSDTKRYAHQEE